MAAQRLNETAEQREARLEDVRNRNAANRNLEDDRNKKAAQRLNETAEQRDARLEEQRNRQAAQRNNNKRLQEERFLNIARKVDTADFVEDETMTVINIGTIFEQDKCQYCNAYLWPKETSYSCCNNGKLSNVLETVPPPPPVLLDLMENNQHFIANIRSYNNALALASLGTEGPPEVGPNFKIQGKLHHSIGPIGPPPAGERPRFAQLYFYDTDKFLLFWA